MRSVEGFGSVCIWGPQGFRALRVPASGLWSFGILEGRRVGVVEFKPAGNVPCAYEAT